MSEMRESEAVRQGFPTPFRLSSHKPNSCTKEGTKKVSLFKRQRQKQSGLNPVQNEEAFVPRSTTVPVDNPQSQDFQPLSSSTASSKVSVVESWLIDSRGSFVGDDSHASYDAVTSTVSQLVRMTRSSIVSQRSFALDIIGKAIIDAKNRVFAGGNKSKCDSLLAFCVESFLPSIARVMLDSTNRTQIMSSIRFLKQVLVNSELLDLADSRFDMYSGITHVFSTPTELSASTEKTSIPEEISKGSVSIVESLIDLVLLPRLNWLIESELCPVDLNLIQVLCCIAQDSKAAARAVVSSGIVKTLAEADLKGERLHCYISLLRRLCHIDPVLCASLFDTGIFYRLKSILLDYSVKSPEHESILQLLRLWRICIYNNVDVAFFANAFESFLHLLSSNHTNNRVQLCLFNVLEALCVSTSERITTDQILPIYNHIQESYRDLDGRRFLVGTGYAHFQCSLYERIAREESTISVSVSYIWRNISEIVTSTIKHLEWSNYASLHTHMKAIPDWSRDNIIVVSSNTSEAINCTHGLCRLYLRGLVSLDDIAKLVHVMVEALDSRLSETASPVVSFAEFRMWEVLLEVEFDTNPLKARRLASSLLDKFGIRPTSHLLKNVLFGFDESMDRPVVVGAHNAYKKAFDLGMMQVEHKGWWSILLDEDTLLQMGVVTVRAISSYWRDNFSLLKGFTPDDVALLFLLGSEYFLDASISESLDSIFVSSTEICPDSELSTHFNGLLEVYCSQSFGDPVFGKILMWFASSKFDVQNQVSFWNTMLPLLPCVSIDRAFPSDWIGFFSFKSVDIRIIRGCLKAVLSQSAQFRQINPILYGICIEYLAEFTFPLKLPEDLLLHWSIDRRDVLRPLLQTQSLLGDVITDSNGNVRPSVKIVVGWILSTEKRATSWFNEKEIAILETFLSK